jgi:hypothetical protein
MVKRKWGENLTNVRDIIDGEALDREIASIRKVFHDLREKHELPMRIEWGTKKAFEEIRKLEKTRFRIQCQNYATVIDEVGNITATMFVQEVGNESVLLTINRQDKRKTILVKIE